MLLRILRGRVRTGREDDFVALCRSQVAREAGVTRGLLSFMAGYRRVDRSDRFVLISTWETEADIVRSAGDRPLEHPRSVDVLADVAEMERADHYELLPPIRRGVLDEPGAVIRVTEATIRPGRKDALLAYVRDLGRDGDTAQLLLGFAMGMRTAEGVEQAVGVSAWASPLAIEAAAEPGRRGTTLFAALDEYVTDVAIERYQAIELRLSERLHALAGLRLIAARFGSSSEAETAQSAVAARFPATNGAGVSIARLAPTAPDGGSQSHVLVARVSHDEHVAAERLIADLGGEVLYEVDEAGA